MKVDSIRILSESETPPFPIDADITVKDELRLKYRFLDLRRPNIQKEPYDEKQGGNTYKTVPC